MLDNDIKKLVSELLDDCLSGLNQECNFEILEIDKNKESITIKFPLVIIEEDNFAGFSGY